MGNRRIGAGSIFILMILFFFLFRLLFFFVGFAMIILALALVARSVMKLINAMNNDNERVSEKIANVVEESRSRLNDEINWWFSMQESNGVGTKLEKAYFTNSPSREQADILAHVNDVVSHGIGLINSDKSDAKTLSDIDHSWLELSRVRAIVTQSS